MQKNRVWLCVILLICLTFTVTKSDSIITTLKNLDPNYWWRFSYWANEVIILRNTCFTGVGFGSAYATIDIFQQLHGGFIDPATGRSVTTASALFTTAQHNSYLNTFYRTGILGGWFFLSYTFDLIFRSRKYLLTGFDSALYLAFINANIIILFNVGLESPQFLLPYFFALTGLMSLRRVNQPKNKEGAK